MADISLHKVILRIPHSLAGLIMTTWINIRELSRLDSAFCNFESRPAFLTTLGSGQVVYPNIPDPIQLLATIPFLIRWLNSKRILMYTLELTPQSLDSELDAYVKIVAGKLRHVSFHNFKENANSIISLFDAREFSNLRSMQFSFSDLPTSMDMKIHLHFMQSTLKEMRFKRCTNLGTTLFEDNCLPNLAILSVSSCQVSAPFISAVASCCRNIEFLNLNDCGTICDEDILSIARNCVSLRLLSVTKQPGLTDVAMEELSTRCPRLMVVDIVGCTSLTDRTITALATNCKQLESIYMRGNSNYTNASMQVLAEHAGATLEVLDVVNCDNISAESVEKLLATCEKVMILYFGDEGGHANYSETAICGVLSKCDKLEKLSLEVSPVSDLMMETLAAHGSALLKLGLHKCTRGLTEVGLHAIAVHCCELELLVVPEECSFVNPFSVMLWSTLRPNLVVTRDDDRIVCKIETQLDYFA